MTTHIHGVYKWIYHGNNYRQESTINIRIDRAGSKFIKNVCTTHYERDVTEKKGQCMLGSSLAEWRPMCTMKGSGKTAAKQVSKWEWRIPKMYCHYRPNIDSQLQTWIKVSSDGVERERFAGNLKVPSSADKSETNGYHCVRLGGYFGVWLCSHKYYCRQWQISLFFTQTSTSTNLLSMSNVVASGCHYFT